MERPVRIFNQFPQGCPPVDEGGGPQLRPSRALAGWGVLGALAGGFAAGINADYTALRVVAFVGAGYLVAAVAGLLLESLAAWSARRRVVDRRPKHDRIPCNYVELAVDSYAFEDEIGKGFDPVERFKPVPPIWNARVEPATFTFADGEPFRDVALLVDAPDEPGPSGVFNVNARQAGFAAGGVTITITRGG